MEKRILLVICTLLLGVSVYKGTLAEIDIDISSYNPADQTTHTFLIFFDKFDSNFTEIVVKSNGTKFSGFYILQAHSFLYNVSLSQFGEVTQNFTGRNVGMVQFFKDPFVTSFRLEKWTDNNDTIMLALVIYDDSAPVPGGCSEMKNGTMTTISPMIEVNDGKDIIAIKSKPPMLNGLSCDISDKEVEVEIYHKYLSSQNFNPFLYYEGIRSMLSVESIRNSSRLVSKTIGKPNIEKLFSSYIGVGEVFNIIVTKNGKASAYVPSVSYGEDINVLIEKDKAGTNGQGFFVALFSILPLFAILIVYRGHAFFHFTTFSLGLSCGSIAAFFVLSHDGASKVDDTFLISILFGFIYGTVWLCIWYQCGIPLLSATLAFLHTGALFASIVYHTGLADNESFHYDGRYWSVFFGIVFTVWFIFSVFTMHGHIFSCSFLGSYILMVTSFNYWMGGNLQYVVINVYRRVFVPNFKTATLDPPFQTTDQLIAFLGLLFLVHGYYKQVKNQRGKPPFPPHNSHRYDGETSPLLGDF